MKEGSQAFADWVRDENRVSFPWSMIDKITPRSAKVVEDRFPSGMLLDIFNPMREDFLPG